ncbi:MAG: sigma-70 family RNA polymerase sigma factor [Spirochaeta sp.]|nr:sigma-70 family RNA polymerase sigma factor [Spirochaeta sp.]
MVNKIEKENNRQDSLYTYFKQIRKIELLTYNEELELSRLIRQGNTEARQRLIESNLRLVVRIAKAYLTPEFSLMDLIQEGNMGLITAASKYDYHKKVRFSTYASWWIKQSIARALSNKRRVIRLPHRKEEKLRKINKTYNQLCQKLMRTPTVAEITEELGFREEEVTKILNMSNSIVSLNYSANDETGILQDLIEDDSFSPDRELINNSLKEDTRRFLETLMEKEKQILLYRFSFYGGKKYTLKKIGAQLGISPETVRQIEIRALKKLRKTAVDLKNYVYN